MHSNGNARWNSIRWNSIKSRVKRSIQITASSLLILILILILIVRFIF